MFRFVGFYVFCWVWHYKSLPCDKSGCHFRQENDGGIVTLRKHNKNIVPIARTLRKNMTEEERRLWYDYLRKYSYARFVRQKVLEKYIADFYCAEAKLVIELDGSEHYSEEGEAYDKELTAFLEEYGLSVIRITNTEVLKNFEGVCEYIDNVVKQRIKL